MIRVGVNVKPPLQASLACQQHFGSTPLFLTFHSGLKLCIIHETRVLKSLSLRNAEVFVVACSLEQIALLILSKPAKTCIMFVFIYIHILGRILYV